MRRRDRPGDQGDDRNDDGKPDREAVPNANGARAARSREDAAGDGEIRDDERYRLDDRKYDEEEPSPHHVIRDNERTAGRCKVPATGLHVQTEWNEHRKGDPHEPNAGRP